MQYLTTEAHISDDGLYRYYLFRCWEYNDKACLFVMLNPSTADADQDDPTIRRCVDFAQRWGCGSLTVLNLFAYRATHPADLLQADDPVGPENEHWLQTFVPFADYIVCAWGVTGGYRDQDRTVMRVLDKCRTSGTPTTCLMETKDGYPAHPLYLPRSSVPRPYGGRLDPEG